MSVELAGKMQEVQFTIVLLQGRHFNWLTENEDKLSWQAIQDPENKVLLAVQEIHRTLPLESKSEEQSKHPNEEQGMHTELALVVFWR